MSLKSYIIYTRPKTWIFFAIYFLTGALFAESFFIHKFIMALFSFILLVSGFLAFNSYYDKDTKEVFFLKKMPKMPKYLLQFSIMLQLAALVFSYFINLKFFVSFLSLALLSTSYSYPKIRLKSVPILDLTANAIIGVIGLYAAYSIAGKNLTVNFIIFLISFFFLGLGLYPLTQIYHYKEDLKRKDRTFTIFLGKKKTLLFSLISFIIGMSILISFYYFYFGIYPSIILFLLIIYFLAILNNWYLDFKKIDEKKEMYKVFRVFILIALYFLVSLLLRLFYNIL